MDEPTADVLEEDPAERVSLRTRLGVFWSRHRTLFWTLHSIWALATGALVVWFARDRYGFLPWVVLFLVLTWASTLFFSRRVGREGGHGAPGLLQETTSYLTRTMYQETLFFLLPFYAYSTVVGSFNVVFTGLLLILALTSCFDLLFDRWLRSNRVFSFFFFALVAFATINLLLPILLPIDPTVGLRWAVIGAIVSGVPIAVQGQRPAPTEAFGLAAVATVFLVGALALPRLIPPVPLRLESLVFSRGIDRESLVLVDTLSSGADIQTLPNGLYVMAEVFAPTIVPTEVSIAWHRDGELLRTSRSIQIVAHDLGFRVWEALKPDVTPLRVGRYRAVVSTGAGRVFGQGEIVLNRGSSP